MRIKFLTILFVFLLSLQVDAATIKNIRSGMEQDKTRIVIDLDEPISYTEKMENGQLKLTLAAEVAKNTQFAPKSEFVKKITVQKNNKKSSIVTIDLNKVPGTYKVFVLKEPNRLVIDLYKFVLEKKTTVLAPGVSYISWRDYLTNRPIWLHALEIGKNSGYEVRPLLGKISTIDKGRLSVIAENTGALAVINASYFDSTKWVIGNLKLEDEWVASELQARTALVIDQQKNAKIIPQVSYQGKVVAGGGTRTLTGINRERIDNDLILYTSSFGSTTGTNQYGTEVRLKDGRVVEVSSAGNMQLDPSTEVLSGHGPSAEFLQKLKKGNRVYLQHDLSNKSVEDAKYIIGAGPLLATGGKVKVMAVEEEFANDIKNGRAPRTAVGIKADGSLILVVVDGRSAYSSGVTLNELAEYLLKLGAVSAMNFDGGGSSEMVIKNKIVNTPSDGVERPIRVALGVLKS